MTKFTFKQTTKGHAVRYRGRPLGEIVAVKEGNGRHSFTLACDTRKRPRIYRGKQQAAEVLLTLDRLKRDAKSRDMLVILAWDNRPRTTAQGAT